MSQYITIKGALLGSLLAVPSVVRAEVAVDPNCWRAEEIEAARFEDFRLKLLVGALNCKNYLPGAATSYNNFLAAKKDLVLANMYVVRAHFVREAGTAEGADQFANYETLAGNKYSTPLFDHAKCETVDSSLKLATSLADTELVKMVEVLSPGPLPSGCKVAPRPAPVVVAVVAAAPPVPVVIAAAAPPAPVVVAAAAPATVALAAAPVVTIPAVAVMSSAPMSDAQRVAASTAATRQLIASRASRTQPVVTPVAVVAPVAPTPVPAVQPASVVPATLLVVDAKPTEAAQPVKAEAVRAEPAAAPAPVPPSAAQALADAARALAAAAAAMQPGAH